MFNAMSVYKSLSAVSPHQLLARRGGGEGGKERTILDLHIERLCDPLDLLRLARSRSSNHNDDSHLIPVPQWLLTFLPNGLARRSQELTRGIDFLLDRSLTQKGRLIVVPDCTEGGSCAREGSRDGVFTSCDGRGSKRLFG